MNELITSEDLWTMEWLCIESWI